jgi:hypothetical protein
VLATSTHGFGSFSSGHNTSHVGLVAFASGMYSTGLDSPDGGSELKMLLSQLITPRTGRSCLAALTAVMPLREWPSIATRSVGNFRCPCRGSSSAMAVALLTW